MNKNRNPHLDEDVNEISTPGAPGTASSVPQGSSLAVPNVQRKASSGFTNLKKYIQANQGNRLAETIVNPAEQNLQKAQNTLQTSQQQFQTQLVDDQAKLAASRTNSQNALGHIETGSGLSLSAMDTADQKAAKILEANNKAGQDLNNVRDYQYAGPTGIQNKQELADKQFELNDFSNASKNEAGRGAILQTLFGKGGNYTAGSRNLDNLLLGADQQGMNRLKDIRSSTTGFNQNLKNLDTQTGASIGAARGNINVAKAVQKTAMQQLRDKIKARLESDATNYNTTQNLDAQTIDDEEVRKYLPELTGYDLSTDPSLGNLMTLPVQPDIQLGNLMTLPVQSTGTDVGGDTDWVNLFKNRDEDFQKVDPNKNLHRQIKQSGGAFHRDWNHDAYGSPNTNSAYVTADSLKPLFKESYLNNTWDSIDGDALNRRNILSDVLADGSQNGAMTPKQKQEIQASIDQNHYNNIKAIPKSAEDVFTNNFYQGITIKDYVNSISNNAKEYGFKDANEAGDYVGLNRFEKMLPMSWLNNRQINRKYLDKYASLMRDKAMRERLKQLNIGSSDFKIV